MATFLSRNHWVNITQHGETTTFIATRMTLCISRTQVAVYLTKLEQPYQCLETVFKREITCCFNRTGYHKYSELTVHKTLNGLNTSSGFTDLRSAKSGTNLCQIWHVFGPWASPYGANGQRTMSVHTYRPGQFHRTSNGENPSSGYRDMGSTSLAAARPPVRTVTIPRQPGGLMGKNVSPPFCSGQRGMNKLFNLKHVCKFLYLGVNNVFSFSSLYT